MQNHVIDSNAAQTRDFSRSQANSAHQFTSHNRVRARRFRGAVGSKLTRHNLAVLAWREFRVNASYQGTMLDEVDPPAWFIRAELGYAIEFGPSIEWTCTNLARHNRGALEQLGHDAPLRVSYPIGFKRISRPSLRRKRACGRRV